MGDRGQSGSMSACSVHSQSMVVLITRWEVIIKTPGKRRADTGDPFEVSERRLAGCLAVSEMAQQGAPFGGVRGPIPSQVSIRCKRRARRRRWPLMEIDGLHRGCAV